MSTDKHENSSGCSNGDDITHITHITNTTAEDEHLAVSEAHVTQAQDDLDGPISASQSPSGEVIDPATRSRTAPSFTPNDIGKPTPDTNQTEEPSDQFKSTWDAENSRLFDKTRHELNLDATANLNERRTWWDGFVQFLGGTGFATGVDRMISVEHNTRNMLTLVMPTMERAKNFLDAAEQFDYKRHATELMSPEIRVMEESVDQILRQHRDLLVKITNDFGRNELFGTIRTMCDNYIGDLRKELANSLRERRNEEAIWEQVGNKMVARGTEWREAYLKVDSRDATIAQNTKDIAQITKDMADLRRELAQARSEHAQFKDDNARMWNTLKQSGFDHERYRSSHEWSQRTHVDEELVDAPEKRGGPQNRDRPPNRGGEQNHNGQQNRTTNNDRQRGLGYGRGRNRGRGGKRRI